MVVKQVTLVAKKCTLRLLMVAREAPREYRVDYKEALGFEVVGLIHFSNIYLAKRRNSIECRRRSSCVSFIFFLSLL